jgi:hypothetical protein
MDAGAARVAFVNFFGHATVATWSSEPLPTYVLGAMLPDFATLSGARSLGAGEPSVARGVALHHRTDDAFHGAPTFVALMIEARARLERAGLGNGPSRATAHIGIEMLLDGTLVGEALPARAFLGAIEAIREEHLVFGSAEHAARFWHFHERVRHYGVPYGYVDPAFVAARVAGALAHRPRLALGDSTAGDVTRVLRDLRPLILERAGALLDEVRAGLAGAPEDDATRR